jgi:hypothetical protein
MTVLTKSLDKIQEGRRMFENDKKNKRTQLWSTQL